MEVLIPADVRFSEGPGCVGGYGLEGCIAICCIFCESGSLGLCLVASREKAGFLSLTSDVAVRIWKLFGELVYYLW